ncbi:hypothetical protein [Bythopirellula goksoeyrii]|uniref:Uncharacterized protein n=1 Tax=Bythopirellula goksoeyrii TaxID=1400387 RepID=A0A5B9QPE3_9BACT|nr:hypothetical protein [Bythopirellula goksoeyrii]QEG35991.1 hypothetical protein Pr1d_33000 [Bythopirellula goksoeyrii]
MKRYDSLFEAIQKIDRELTQLASSVRKGTLKAVSAEQAIRRLNQFVETAGPHLQEHGQAFEAVKSKAVLCNGSMYSSAHHAVFGEAGKFLHQLWILVDLESFDELALKPISDLGDELHRKLIYGTGLEPSLILERWERVEADLQKLFSNNCFGKSSSLLTALKNEKAAILAMVKQR